MNNKPRLLKSYKTEIAPKLREEFDYSNIMAVPKVTKISINIGMGEAKVDIKLLEEASKTLTAISGQRAVTRRAKKSISNFKLRQGQPIGTMVTLRGDRMYEFLDRLIALALLNSSDFSGASAEYFDGRGNYSIGTKDQPISPEVDYRKITRTMGLNDPI